MDDARDRGFQGGVGFFFHYLLRSRCLLFLCRERRWLIWNSPGVTYGYLPRFSMSLSV
jgi:hypothetical protein